MTVKIHDTVPFFQSNALKKENSIVHGFFTRNGGTSERHLSSLNVSFKKNDLPSNVLENRRRIIDSLAKDTEPPLVTLEQVHGIVCHKVQQPLTSPLKGDALVTKTPNLLLGILTADCVPVLFADPENKVVGAAHAGWRGAIKGITSSTLKKMLDLGAKIENIKAIIGPCIHKKSYEVGLDVYEKLKEKNVHISSFLSPHRENTWLFNLPNFVEESLTQDGILEIDNINIDTYENEDLFFSCRRSYHKKEEGFGIQLSVIGLC